MAIGRLMRTRAGDRRGRRQSADGARQGAGGDRAGCADRDGIVAGGAKSRVASVGSTRENAMKLALAAWVAVALLLGLAAGAGADLSDAGYAGGGRTASRQRRRCDRALLCRQALAALGQTGDRGEQARHDPVRRRRCGREGTAGRLHHPHYVGHVVACGEPVQFQEAAIRPDQGLHPGRDAAEELLHPDGAC